MKTKLYLLLILFLGCTTMAMAQVKSNIQNPTSINDNGADPDNSAILDVQSTNKGILVPRMTTAERNAIASPANGLLVFDLNTSSFWFYSLGSWQNLAGGGGGTGSSIVDADNDTKVQVEESADEDVIRFDLAGSELARMENATFHIQAPGENIFIGTNTGIANSSGTQNTFLGVRAGEANTTGEWNTFIGWDAGKTTTTGNYNTFLGKEAGRDNETGSHNAFIGEWAGLNHLSGEENVFLGSHTGLNNETGSGNIFIGYSAGQTELGSNRLYIENSSSASPLIYGEFDNNLLRVNGSLNVNNAFTFPTTDGGGGQVLQTDGAGNVSWANAGGSSTLLEDADMDTKIQVEESADEDIIRFDLAGSEEYVFGTNANGDATFSLPGSNNNVFIGNNAGAANVNSDPVLASTFVGHNAGMANTSGTQNTFLGADAGMTNTTGIRNSFLGEDAGFSNETGNNNTMIGAEAGRNNVAGSGNVFLGVGAGQTELGSNRLYIENSSSASPLIYGEFDNNLLRVNGSLNINSAFTFPTTDGGGGQVLRTNGAGNVSWTNDNVNDADASPTNELQTLSIVGSNLSISSGNTVALPASTLLEDADMDTKIQVEESADEDVIRFDVAGSEEYVFGTNANGDATLALPGSNNNIFIGNNAGAANTNTLGSGANTFMGHDAGAASTFGISNTYIGADAGMSNVDGSANTFVGEDAGTFNINGSNNTFIGEDAGINATGSGNVFLGVDAGANEAGDNKLYIENSNSASPLIYGEFDNNIARINGRLEATGGFNDADGDTKIQVEESADEDIIRMDLAGVERLRIRENNTASNLTMIEVPNSAQCVFLGEFAGNLNTAPFNTFIGNRAGDANTTGTQSTFVGVQAGDNTTTGGFNVFVGTGAGIGNTEGFGNVFIGEFTGGTNTTGDQNTCVGDDANVTTGNLVNASSFGFGANVNASNKVRIGNANVTVIEGQVDWSFPSDGRFKNNINENVKGLEFITRLRPVTYHFDVAKFKKHISSEVSLNSETGLQGSKLTDEEIASMEEASKIIHTGFIAQEVENAARAAGFSDFGGVLAPKHEKDNYGLRYGTFVVPLVKAVQEQQDIIESLKEDKLIQSAAIESLKLENEEFRSRMDKLEALIQNKDK